MSNFAEFYANGGIFMHAVTLTSIAALVALSLHGRARRMGDDDPKRLRLADRLTVLVLGLGVLGTVFGMIEVFAVLGMVEVESYDAALSRGMAIAPVPLAWSLMCAIPLWVASTVHRHRSPKIVARSEAAAAH